MASPAARSGEVSSSARYEEDTSCDDKAPASHQSGPDVIRDAKGDIPPLSASWRQEPLSDEEKTKTQQILEACRDRDYDELNKLAASRGGYIEDELRRVACTYISCVTATRSCNCRVSIFRLTAIKGPILLGTNRDTAQVHSEKVGQDWHDLERHRDEDQVQLDVNRSFVYYPNGIVYAHLPTLLPLQLES